MRALDDVCHWSEGRLSRHAGLRERRRGLSDIDR